MVHTDKEYEQKITVNAQGLLGLVISHWTYGGKVFEDLNPPSAITAVKVKWPEIIIQTTARTFYLPSGKMYGGDHAIYGFIKDESMHEINSVLYNGLI